MSSREDPRDVDAGEGDAAQLAADSVSDLVDRNRVQQIFQARSRARRAFQQADVMEADPAQRVGRQELTHAVTSAIQSYILELEPLIQSADETVTARYWDELELGALHMTAPDLDEEFHWSTSLTKVTNPDGTVTNAAQPVSRTFVGLNDLVTADPPFSFSWDFQLSKRHHGTETETITRRVAIPRHVLRSAYRAANRFSAEVDLDLKLEETADEVEMEYLSPDADGWEGSVK